MAAVADTLRCEALRVVELEAENAALQGRVRELAQKHKHARMELRALGHKGFDGNEGGHSFDMQA